MKRGELYLVRKPSAHGQRKEDPKKQRVFVIVSRQVLIDSRHSTVVCVPVYSQYDGLSTQVPVGLKQGLKKDSSIHCDELVSLPKPMLTGYVGSLDAGKLRELDRALLIALDLESRGD